MERKKETIFKHQRQTEFSILSYSSAFISISLSSEVNSTSTHDTACASVRLVLASKHETLEPEI